MRLEAAGLSTAFEDVATATTVGSDEIAHTVDLRSTTPSGTVRVQFLCADAGCADLRGLQVFADPQGGASPLETGAVYLLSAPVRWLSLPEGWVDRRALSGGEGVATVTHDAAGRWTLVVDRSAAPLGSHAAQLTAVLSDGRLPAAAMDLTLDTDVEGGTLSAVWHLHLAAALTSRPL
jgi:hypothetical protein